MRYAFAMAVGLCVLACSGATPTVQLPARDLNRALCALEVVEQLPPDPKRVAYEDVTNLVREYKACIEVPADAGTGK